MLYIPFIGPRRCIPVTVDGGGERRTEKSDVV